MIVIRATLPLDPDRMDEAADLGGDLAEASRAEDGVVDYQVAEDLESPGVLRIFEVYEDADAFAAHGDTDHLAAFQAAIPDLLVGEPELTRYEVSDSGPVEI